MRKHAMMSHRLYLPLCIAFIAISYMSQDDMWRTATADEMKSVRGGDHCWVQIIEDCDCEAFSCFSNTCDVNGQCDEVDDNTTFPNLANWKNTETAESGLKVQEILGEIKCCTTCPCKQFCVLIGGNLTCIHDGALCIDYDAHTELSPWGAPCGHPAG